MSAETGRGPVRRACSNRSILAVFQREENGIGECRQRRARGLQPRRIVRKPFKTERFGAAALCRRTAGGQLRQRLLLHAFSLQLGIEHAPSERARLVFRHEAGRGLEGCARGSERGHHRVLPRQRQRHRPAQRGRRVAALMGQPRDPQRHVHVQPRALEGQAGVLHPVRAIDLHREIPQRAHGSRFAAGRRPSAMSSPQRLVRSQSSPNRSSARPTDWSTMSSTVSGCA
jgi:hypothetical protein